MTVHVLSDGNFAVLRFNKEDEIRLREALGENGFTCGETRDVIEIPSFFDINIKRNDSWSKISVDDVKKVVANAGLSLS